MNLPIVPALELVYLAGPIFATDDAECVEWRKEATTLLGVGRVVDPMRRDYRGKEDQKWVQIVPLDLADIDRSRIVLANVARPTWGTAMEIREAWLRKKRIVGFGAPERVSPWLLYHVNELFPTLAEAVEAIQ